MVANRLERMVGRVRKWRTGTVADPLSAPISVASDLPAGDLKKLRSAIEDCLSARGGEIAARRRATAIGATFLNLNETGRRNFFRLLADEYDHDDDSVDQAMQAVIHSTDPDARRLAEQTLSEALRPKRERLLRRFVGLEDGLPFLVDLREELLVHRRSDRAMAAVDNDLRSLLETWFDIALLRLERLTWDETPAALLEKLIQYEAVHAIESWDDLRGRLGPGRRCYAFLHTMMPGEPLIFVEVALTNGIAKSLEPLLDHGATLADAGVDTAIFYSISNCHRGLAGVSLGDFLIKKVVQELALELPGINKFATLSPIPGFRRWLVRALETNQLLTPEEQSLISSAKPELAQKVLKDLVSSELLPARVTVDPLEAVLKRLTALYLVEGHLLSNDSQEIGPKGQPDQPPQSDRPPQRVLDPVAHFHLSNGARVERLNWWANPSQTGWERGLGMMVNYRYLPRDIESNHDDYVASTRVHRSDEVQKLLSR